MLLAPELIPEGVAVNELIVGLSPDFTITVSVDVLDPAAFVAVKVYVVVAVGLMLVEPLADVEVNVPGVMATLVAPATAQLSMLPLPEFTLVGSAVNELITGRDPLSEFEFPEVLAPHPASPPHRSSAQTSAQSLL